MRVYLAARTTVRPLLVAWRDELESRGHTVTARWIDRAVVSADIAQIARQDLLDVEKADALLCHNPPEYAFSGHGGRHVEFGYALALGKLLILVGERSNVFHSAATVFVAPTFHEALVYLEAMADAEHLRQRTIRKRPWHHDL